MLRVITLGFLLFVSTASADNREDASIVAFANLPSQDHIKCRTLEMRANAQCGGVENPNLCKARLAYLKPCEKLNAKNPMPEYNEDGSSANTDSDMTTQTEDEPVVFEEDPFIGDMPEEFRY